MTGQQGHANSMKALAQCPLPRHATRLLAWPKPRRLISAHGLSGHVSVHVLRTGVRVAMRQTPRVQSHMARGTRSGDAGSQAACKPAGHCQAPTCNRKNAAALSGPRRVTRASRLCFTPSHTPAALKAQAVRHRTALVGVVNHALLASQLARAAPLRGGGGQGWWVELNA